MRLSAIHFRGRSIRQVSCYTNEYHPRSGISSRRRRILLLVALHPLDISYHVKSDYPEVLLRVGLDYILSLSAGEETHQHLVVELHPYLLNKGLGLGCGLPIPTKCGIPYRCYHT